MGFRFLDPGPLRDGELELVAPHRRWINDLIAGSDPTQARLTCSQVEDFLRVAPEGHQAGEAVGGRVPAYHFWMRLHAAPQIAGDNAGATTIPRWANGRAGSPPPLQIAGGIGLRIGQTPDIELYLGNIGYNVQPFARGNHYAERACRLLKPLALAHGIRPLWITCNPDNIPSRRTCERLGCVAVETLQLPLGHALRVRGDREKIRFRWDI
jgi:RimJ/RimL family protein N-acetyltransferase